MNNNDNYLRFRSGWVVAATRRWMVRHNKSAATGTNFFELKL